MNKVLRFFRDVFFLEDGISFSLFPRSNFSDFYKKEIIKCYLNQVYVCGKYTNNLDTLIQQYKYYHSHRNIGDIIDILESVVHNNSEENITSITYVPHHISGILKNNFSHTLAKKLSKQLRVPCKWYVKKMQKTLHQAQLSASERKKNLKNVFSIKKRYTKQLKNQNILLVDDVISTGSTANEIARVLKKHWANKVMGVFLASNSGL